MCHFLTSCLLFYTSKPSEKSAKPPMVYSTDRCKAVVPVLVLLFVALWFNLRGDLFYVYLVLFCSCVFESF